MKIKSLLAAVSMVALTAGSANALILTAPAGTLVPADELNTPFDPSIDLGVTQIAVEANANSSFTPSARFFVTVDLPSGVVFQNDVTGLSITAPAGTIVDSATLQNGTGLEGSSSVTYLASLNAAATVGSQIIIDLPLGFANCVTGDLSVTVTTEEGTIIEQGTVTADDPIIGACAPALSANVVSDEDTSDTVITLASDFEDLAGDTSGIQGTLGTIQFEVDTDVSVDLTAAAPMTAADIESFTFDVCFDDATAIDTVMVGASAGVKSGNTFSFEVTDAAAIAALILAPNRIIATTTGDDAVISQQPTVKNVAATFDNDDLIDDKALMGGDLDALQREGIQFGFFDWNAGPAIANPTVSVYRITRLTPGETIGYSLTVDNSLNDGTYNGTLTADAAGEAALFSTSMPIPADIGRFDVLINLETSNNCVDVDRLMIRNDVVSAFNDGANLDSTDRLEPRGDVDNFPSASTFTPYCEVHTP